MRDSKSASQSRYRLRGSYPCSSAFFARYNEGMSISAQDRARKIKVILFDVDGVLTDGTLWLIPGSPAPAGEMMGEILGAARTVDRAGGTGLHGGGTVVEFLKRTMPAATAATITTSQMVCGGEDQIRAVKVTILWAEFGLRVGSGIVVHGSIVS